MKKFRWSFQVIGECSPIRSLFCKRPGWPLRNNTTLGYRCAYFFRYRGSQRTDPRLSAVGLSAVQRKLYQRIPTIWLARQRRCPCEQNHRELEGFTDRLNRLSQHRRSKPFKSKIVESPLLTDANAGTRDVRSQTLEALRPTARPVIDAQDLNDIPLQSIGDV